MLASALCGPQGMGAADFGWLLLTSACVAKTTPVLVFSPFPALGWALTLPDTCPQAGVVHLGFHHSPWMWGWWPWGWAGHPPGCLVGCSPAAQCQVLGTVVARRVLPPTASTTAIWVSLLWQSPLPVWGCLWRGWGGSHGVILSLGVGGMQGWKILLLGLAGRWVMGCKAMAKLMWDDMSWRALPVLSSV